jgi:hypothetical protein
VTYEDRARDIAEAIRELARATDREGAATERLVAIREQEIRQAAEIAADRLASDEAARAEMAAYTEALTKTGPAIQLLITIAEAMRGERRK